MKAFIFVALVASVAARGMDFDTLRLAKERTLLTKPIVDELLLKEKLGQRYPVEKTIVGDVVDRVVPVEQEQLLRGIYDVDRVLTFEEIYNTELFREYLAIPLFREYIQYPVFQRYVASVYFQRFWQIPSFQQYFLNPVYFYKYVYPLVQLFTTEYNTPYQVPYGQDVYGRDIVGRQSYDDLIVRNKNVFPYVYGQQTQDVISRRYELPTFAGQYYPTTQGVNYKFILDKIYKDLFINQDVAEIKTPYYYTPEVYQQYQQIRDIPTINRRDVYTPYLNRFVQGERYNLFNRLYNNLYNQEIPAIRENTVYDRLPIQRQQVLGNIVA
ncbi:hypothetical protein Ocin01_08414 [Orchesella cincta]|uniref:Uncharacterized protein n=1 Tax=Orchesella cincta TaxID=48709 RepID=A0A1D2MZ52_ORCCI|nr:hypothetical protein Ocin01_08414 [Orchesella cincta]